MRIRSVLALVAGLLLASVTASGGQIRVKGITRPDLDEWTWRYTVDDAAVASSDRGDICSYDGTGFNAVASGTSCRMPIDMEITEFTLTLQESTGAHAFFIEIDGVRQTDSRIRTGQANNTVCTAELAVGDIDAAGEGCQKRFSPPLFVSAGEEVLIETTTVAGTVDMVQFLIRGRPVPPNIYSSQVKKPNPRRWRSAWMAARQQSPLKATFAVLFPLTDHFSLSTAHGDSTANITQLKLIYKQGAKLVRIRGYGVVIQDDTAIGDCDMIVNLNGVLQEWSRIEFGTGRDPGCDDAPPGGDLDAADELCWIVAPTPYTELDEGGWVITVLDGDGTCVNGEVLATEANISVWFEVM